MKSIIIDWDFPPSDLRNVFTELLSPECNVIITSACNSRDTIEAELRQKNLYPHADQLKKNLIILSFEDLVENRGSNKKEIGSIQGELLENYYSDGANKNDITFVSTNLHARSAAYPYAGIRVSTVPKSIEKSKPVNLPPYQTASSYFQMNEAHKLNPSSGNTFASTGEESVYKVCESENRASTWYAKKRDVSKLHRVQLEVLSNQIFHQLLGDQFPQSQYMLSENKQHAYVLSKESHGFQNMNHPESISRLKENEFKGVLPALFLSMFLEEADLRADNMGVDSKGRFVKIDNDGTFASLIFNMKQHSADKYSFTSKDIDNPHKPQSFDAATWQTDFFKNEELMTEENKIELYSFWHKLLHNKQTIFQLIDNIIENSALKKMVVAKMNVTFQNLETLLKNHPEYNQFAAKQIQSKQESVKTRLTDIKREEAPALLNNSLNSTLR